MTRVWDLRWDWPSVAEFLGDAVTYSLESRYIVALGKKAASEAINQAKIAEALAEAARDVLLAEKEQEFARI